MNLPICLLFQLAMQTAGFVDKRRTRRAAVENLHDVPDDEASPLDARR